MILEGIFEAESMADSGDCKALPEEFLMFSYKVQPCSRKYPHDWASCPCGHKGERAARRDLRSNSYLAIACTYAKQRLTCPRGDSCPHAHNLFEYWLHPQRYRTELCQYGSKCERPVCFFAHSMEELRTLDAGLPPAETCWSAGAAVSKHRPQQLLDSGIASTTQQQLVYLPIQNLGMFQQQQQLAAAAAAAAASSTQLAQQQQPMHMQLPGGGMMLMAPSSSNEVYVLPQHQHQQLFFMSTPTTSQGAAMAMPSTLVRLSSLQAPRQQQHNAHQLPVVSMAAVAAAAGSQLLPQSSAGTAEAAGFAWPQQQLQFEAVPAQQAARPQYTISSCFNSSLSAPAADQMSECSSWSTASIAHNSVGMACSTLPLCSPASSQGLTRAVHSLMPAAAASGPLPGSCPHSPAAPLPGAGGLYQISNAAMATIATPATSGGSSSLLTMGQYDAVVPANAMGQPVSSAGVPYGSCVVGGAPGGPVTAGMVTAVFREMQLCKQYA